MKTCSSEELDAKMTDIIQSGWGKNWKRESRVLCDQIISLTVKGKVYKTVVGPPVMYAAETWTVKNVVEMRVYDG